MTETDSVRELIARRVNEMGTNLSDISKKIGKNHAYLQQFIKRGVPARLPEQVRNQLASLIDVDESALGGPSSQRRVTHESFPQNARVGGQAPIWGTIPVYGHPVGGKDGQYVLNGNKVADILAPASLFGVPDAYAVYVVGRSMENRYYAGEAVYVNPRMPIRTNDFVVAKIATHEGDPPLAYIKQFLMWDDRRLRLRQFNPKKTLEFPNDKVVSVHRIIMGGDG